jgi:hypothetical protein
VQADVVEEQVEVEGLPVHGQRDLAPHEGEAAAQLQEEVAKMGQESSLDLPLLRSLGHSQEIEVVEVFEDLLRHIRLWRGQLSLEVGLNPTLLSPGAI